MIEPMMGEGFNLAETTFANVTLKNGDTAYLLDVLSHQDWTNETLVEIAVRNWPNDRLFFSMPSAVGLSETVSRDDRKKLRAAGVSTLIEVDGKVFMAAQGGLTTAGTSQSSSMQANRLLMWLRDQESKLAADPSHFWSLIPRNNRTLPDHPEFRVLFVQTPNWWGFAIVVIGTDFITPVVV
jgi:hypothetical protein